VTSAEFVAPQKKIKKIVLSKIPVNTLGKHMSIFLGGCCSWDLDKWLEEIESEKKQDVGLIVAT
jgi:hypothetical protein